jgi:membrane-associated phospholipid phosphatase
MQLPRILALAGSLLAVASPGFAQSLPPAGVTPPVSAGQVANGQKPGWLAPDQIDLSPRTEPANPFKAVGGDLKRFFSADSIRFIGLASIVAVAAAPFDDKGIEESQEHWAPSPGVFEPGNFAGSFAVQAGAGLATYVIGKAAGSHRTAEVGGDLLRAQMVSQIVVQGAKFATQRERPDGSNDHSFPSGHTASAFATATVLERHFGWKVGVPSYAFAAYVGASRMSANKHHLSDVMMGAALGIAAGRVVTVGVGGTKFDMGVAPTRGGAAVTFTKSEK